MSSSGYVKAMRWGRVPVYAHWSTLVSLIPWPSLSDALIRTVGMWLVILSHEAGHALVARSVKCRPIAIHVHLFGGDCTIPGWASQRQMATVAWGGVLGQLVLLGIALLYGSIHHVPYPSFRVALLSWLFPFNVAVAALNLLPFGRLDGRRAWSLLGLHRPRAPAPRERSRPKRRGHMRVVGRK